MENFQKCPTDTEGIQIINLKRIKRLAVVVTVLIFALLCRAFYIQIISHDNLSEGALSQYEISVEGLDTRGAILDRNYMPLTGGKSQYYYFVKKTTVDWAEHNTYTKTKGEESPEVSRAAVFAQLIEALNARQIARSDSDYYVFRTEKFDSEINQSLKQDYDAYVFESKARYSDEQMACHLIGYINQDEKIGVSGLELQFEDMLKADNSKLTLWADGTGTILLGKEPVVENVFDNEENNVLVTTIDRRIQAVTEKALSGKTKKGAAAVMDAQTGEILAWVSLPIFNPNDLGEYLKDDSDCLINKVSQAAYAPGSVFKIVTAAAALEAGIPADTEYECLGEVTVEGVTLGCSTAPEGGHGIIDMTTAMAHSCNCYFAQLGQTVGVDAIVKQAEIMGFGSYALEDYPGEVEGNLPSAENVGAWDTSNISIGQGQLLATPLQIAKMTAVIANDGKPVSMHVVGSETDDNASLDGNAAPDDSTLPNGNISPDGNIADKERQIISPETAEQIQKMLGMVMTDGTAKDDWQLPVYGKTGTAEFGETNNCWFTGYCEVSNGKKYVITVLAEDGISGSTSALPVFREIVEYIQKTQE